jgi:hypothetical protein
LPTDTPDALSRLKPGFESRSGTTPLHFGWSFGGLRVRLFNNHGVDGLLLAAGGDFGERLTVARRWSNGTEKSTDD